MTRRTLIGRITYSMGGGAFAAAAGLRAASHGEGAQAARDQIAELGGLVLEIAQNDDRLDVSFRGVKGLTDDALAVLGRLPKTVYLRLGGTDVGDGALDHVAKLSGLLRLNLENTKITDAGLAKIKSLENLEYLNVYSTAIGDAGLAGLSGLKSLKRLYLWQTKVSDAGVAKLQESLPDLEIDRGWEAPPQTESSDESSNQQEQ